MVLELKFLMWRVMGWFGHGQVDSGVAEAVGDSGLDAFELSGQDGYALDDPFASDLRLGQIDHEIDGSPLFPDSFPFGWSDD